MLYKVHDKEVVYMKEWISLNIGVYDHNNVYNIEYENFWRMSILSSYVSQSAAETQSTGVHQPEQPILVGHY